MAVIHDIRSKTPRTNGTRSLSKISKLARHHSGGTTGSWDSFWPYWNKTKGWGTGGYHEIILRDGSVQLCYDPEEITNGVGGHNGIVYHICVVGNGSFTDAQERTWEERSLYNLKRLKLSVSDVLGHREFSGTNTACPGIDMGMVRNRLLYLQGNASKVEKDTDALFYLKAGDAGLSVTKLQQDLILIGYRLKADSSFGPATEMVIKDFQSKQKLTVDGVAGPATLKALSSVVNIVKTESLKPKEEPKVTDKAKNAQPTKSLIPEFKEAVALKITDGTYPNKAATKAEVAVMIVRAVKLLKDQN